MADNGIAAHWLYKSSDIAPDEAQIRAREWLNNLMEMQESTRKSLEFIENVKIDLFPDEVYVFTPKGDIMELPRVPLQSILLMRCIPILAIVVLQRKLIDVYLL